MTNKSSNLSKRKLPRTSYKSARSTISATSSSLYSGIASAQREIQNPVTEYSTQSKFSLELSAIFGTEDNSSARVQYHPWETKYNQICTRGIMRKAMEKEPYTVTKYLVNHAKECVVTEEECHPVLIPMKAIRIEKLIIRGEDKPAASSSARQVRTNSVTPSERFLPPIVPKRPSVPRLQVETKRSLPLMLTDKNIKSTTNSATMNPITGRVKLRNDPKIIQRSAGRVSMETVHESIAPLAVYA